MSNRMAEVADLLGIKLGEVFFIQEYPTYSRVYLKLTEKGIRQSFDKDSWSKASGGFSELRLIDILTNFGGCPPDLDKKYCPHCKECWALWAARRKEMLDKQERNEQNEQ